MDEPRDSLHPGKRQAGPRVLVVDANRRNLMILGRRLGERGYRVVAVESASAAIAELIRAPVELVLADLRLPRMDGIELTRVIRGQALWHDLPLILIAGRSNASGVIDGLAGGADDVVVKPFHFDILFARIARQLARARALAELRHDNAVLDARIVRRSIELGELHGRLLASEAERRRLAGLIDK